MLILKKLPMPEEMKRKLDKFLAMNYWELEEAYKTELASKNLPFPDHPPTLDLIYKLLIPEVFELAHQFRIAREAEEAEKQRAINAVKTAIVENEKK